MDTHRLFAIIFLRIEAVLFCNVMEKEVVMPPVVGHPLELNWTEYYFLQEELDRTFKSMVGKVMEHVEALGLSDRQENAAKSLIKDSIWKQAQRTYANISYWIPEEEKSGVGSVKQCEW